MIWDTDEWRDAVNAGETTLGLIGWLQAQRDEYKNVVIFEDKSGDWLVDYQGPGGDYRVVFAGPDAELRARMYCHMAGLVISEDEEEEVE